MAVSLCRRWDPVFEGAAIPRLQLEEISCDFVGTCIVGSDIQAFGLSEHHRVSARRHLHGIACSVIAMIVLEVRVEIRLRSGSVRKSKTLQCVGGGRSR